jgi:predicted acyl esterase
MIYSYNNISGKLIRFIQSQLTGVAKNTLAKPIITRDGVMLQGILYMPSMEAKLPIVFRVHNDLPPNR